MKIVLLICGHWKPLEHWSIHLFSQGIAAILYSQRALLPTYIFLKHPLHFFFDYRTQVSLGSDLWVLMSVRPSVTERLFADLTDVTLADEDSNSIPTDDVNSAI